LNELKITESLISELRALGYPEKVLITEVKVNFRGKNKGFIDLAVYDDVTNETLAIFEVKNLVSSYLDAVDQIKSYANTFEQPVLCYIYVFNKSGELKIGQCYTDRRVSRELLSLPTYERLKAEYHSQMDGMVQQDKESLSDSFPSHISAKISRFLKKYPIEKLPFMTLEEYSNVTNKSYFTYWLEHETSEVGGVKGGSSFKFGIFKRKSKDNKVGNNTYSYTSNYAWYSRYGATEEVAFKIILEHIVKTANCARNGRISEITKIPLDSRIKWKIAFLYQDFSTPKIVSIYKREALLELSQIPLSEFSIAKAHETLIERKPKKTDVWSYSNKLWHQWFGKEPESRDEQANQVINEDEQELLLDNDIVQITGFTNDDLAGSDQLGIETEIDALASIIAFKETQPPLSIGIFGEWGSGKSFYMDLLQQKIEDIANTARNSHITQREYPFYKHIKQIKFNAWNYVESDLWASLAHTIYENLYQLEDSSSAHDSHWLRIVKYGEEEVKQKEVEIQTLEKELEFLDKKHETLKSNQKELELADNNANPDDVLQQALDKSLREKCTNYISKVGLTNEISTINDAITLAKEVGSLSNRMSLFYKAVSKTTLTQMALLLLLPVIVFILSFFSFDEGSAFVSTMATTLTFISTATIWLKSRVSKVSGWLSELEGIQLNVSSTKQSELKKLEITRANNDKKIKETVDKLEQNETQKKQVEAKIKEAKLNLNELTPESVLAHHINETIGANRYGKFLGLPAILSKDFDTLSRTIEQQNISLEDYEKYQTITDEEEAEDAKYRINRIVLYIDDLDRCEPRTVVKVLEAVHLFLASPLFVVVLGVDPRWLFSSIKEHYSSIMNNNDKVGIASSISTPEEYLEKIFQIPIWLESPTSSSVKELISSIIGTTYDERESLAQSVNVDNIHSQSSLNTRLSDDVKPVSHDRKGTNEGEYHQEAELLNKKTEQLIRAQQHKLEIIELEYINSLSHILIRSPRAVKRYLNIYRLIKSSLDEAQYRSFMNSTDDNVEGFKAAAFLLAVVVSYPRLASELMNKCNRTNSSCTISELVADLEEGGPILDDFKSSCMKIESFKKELSGLKVWAKLVARYSYCKLDCI